MLRRVCCLALCLGYSVLFVSIGDAQTNPPTALSGHSSGIATLVSAPDNRTLISGGLDRSIRFWDLSNGNLLRTLDAQPGQILSLAVSPDGRTLLAGGRDGSIKRWDVFVPGPLRGVFEHKAAVGRLAVAGDGSWVVTGDATGKLRITPLAGEAAARELAGHDADIARLAIRKDGATLASADANGIVRLWNAADGAELGTLGAHAGEVTGLAFHPTEPRLMTAGADGLVRLWQLPVQPRRELAEHKAAVTSAAMSADGKLAVTGSADNSVRLFDPATGKLIRELPGATSPVHSVALSADASIVAAGDETGNVRFWNAADGADRLHFAGHTGAVSDVAFHPTQPIVATAGADGSVRTWRLPEAAKALAGHTMPIQTVAISADGTLAVTAGADKIARLWTLPAGTLARALPASANAASSAAFSPDAKLLAMGEVDGAVRLWNTADATPAGELLAHAGPVVGLAFSGDGTQLLSTGEDGTLRRWRLPIVPARSLAGNAAAVTATVVSPDGKLIYTGSADGAIRVFDSATDKVVRQLAGQVGAVTALVIDKANSVVAACNETGEIRFWKTADGSSLLAGDGGRLLGPPIAIRALAFHPGGKQVAAAGDDGAVRVWNLPTEAKRIAGGQLTDAVAAISPNRAKIATAGVVGGKPTIQIRDAASGNVLGNIVGHEGPITGVAFNSDATKLVTTSADKTVRVWNLAAAGFPVLGQFDGHMAVTRAAVFSADASQIFSAGDDKQIRQWTVADAMEVRALAGHSAAIHTLKLVGATLISGAADNTLRTWNAANGQPIRAFPHGAAVTATASNANATRLASTGADKSVKIWNAADGKLLATIAPEGPAATAPAISSLAFDAAGTLLVGGGAGGIRVWNEAGAIQERLATDADVRAIEFADGAAVLAVAADNAIVSPTRAHVLTIAAHTKPATGVAFSADGNQVVSGGADAIIRLWNAADGKAIRDLAGPKLPVAGMAVSADGSKLAAVSADKAAYVWNLKAPVAAAPLAAEQTLAMDVNPTAVALSADGGRVAIATEDGRSLLGDAISGLWLQRSTPHTGKATAIGFVADDSTIVSGGEDKGVAMQALAALPAIVVVPPAANGATAKPTAMAMLPGATKLAITTDDKRLLLFDMADGKAAGAASGAAAALTCVAARADGGQLAAGGADGNLLLWPVDAKGPGAAVPIAVGSPINAMDYSRDGTRIAVSCADKTLHVYDAATRQPMEFVVLADVGLTEAAAAVAFLASAEAPAIGESLLVAGGNVAAIHSLALLRSWSAHEGGASSVAFTPDGTKLVSGGADKLARVWNAADAASVATLSGAADVITDLAVSKDAAFVAASSADKSVHVWKLPAAVAAQPVAVEASLAHDSPLRTVDFGGDASRLVTAGEDGVVQVWDVATRTRLQRYLPRGGAITQVALADDNITLLSTSTDQTASVETVAASLVFAADPEAITDAAFTPDGAAIISVGSEPAVKQWDLTGKLGRQLSGAKAAFGRVAVRGDGAQISAADVDGRLYLWNAADAALAATIETGAAVTELGYSPGHQQIVAAGADQQIRVFATEDGAVQQTLASDTPLTTVAFTADGRQMLTNASAGDAQHGFAEWAFASPAEQGAWAGHTGAVYALAFSPDGMWAASAGADQTVRVWNVETGQVAKQLSGHAAAIYGLAFQADSKQLVSGSADGSARLWNVDSGAEVRQFVVPVAQADETESPKPVAPCLAVAAQGNLIATANGDGSVYLWNAASGQLAKTMEALDGAVYRVALNADATKLLAVNHSGWVVIWNIADGKPLLDTSAPAVAYDGRLTTDGSRLAIAGADGIVHLLDVPAAAR